MKRCSITLVSREMQIKSIMRYYYYIPIRIAKIFKDHTKFWQGCEATGTHTMLVGM